MKEAKQLLEIAIWLAIGYWLTTGGEDGADLYRLWLLCVGLRVGYGVGTVKID